MRPSRPTSKSIQRDLTQAWKLLNQLAETLTRIAEDTAAISQAAAAEKEAARAARTGKRGRPATKSTNGKSAANRSANRAAKGLPDTTGDFFARHVKKRKQTAAQIFQSVLGSLDVEPSKEQAAILRNRLAVWLSNASKAASNPVNSEGVGKERRYFLG
ncbi:MAG TPA: hypothetical protein VEC06_09075 [Paucimonas sp.]|nr:hypothetical protein [Paucimonas sp.]